MADILAAFGHWLLPIGCRRCWSRRCHPERSEGPALALLENALWNLGMTSRPQVVRLGHFALAQNDNTDSQKQSQRPKVKGQKPQAKGQRPKATYGFLGFARA